MDSREVNRFRNWLTERGAEILNPTNPYEVIRFKANGATQVIYSNNKGRAWHSVGGAHNAVLAFRTNSSWTAGHKRRRRSLGNVVLTLLERDGNRCFYCDKTMQDEQMTIEHLFPHAHGGTSHLSNLALAHPKCNKRGGHLNVVAKVRLRDRLIAARTETEQAEATRLTRDVDVEMFGEDSTEQHDHLGIQNLGNK
jgi:5-methylcytosine-specific restriction endonuclease McrA